VTKLNAAVSDALREPDLKAEFEKIGVQVEIMDVDATSKFIESERVRWGDIIRSAHVTID
jgi:tripartite-type tricarboxylate transporter receptor subunit TctC